mgnify:CR=1 FL=1
MTDTPILGALHDAIIENGMGCGFDELDALLRLALPWDLPALDYNKGRLWELMRELYPEKFR